MTVYAEGVDYSYGRPNLGQLAAALGPGGFVARYITGPVPKVWLGSGKATSPAEVTAIHTAGLGLMVVYEANPGFMLGGTLQAGRDAPNVQAWIRALGLPAGMPVRFALDLDANPVHLSLSLAYLQEMARLIGADRVSGYGGIRAVEAWAAHAPGRGWWQTYAWSSGQVSPHAALLQYSNNVTAAGALVDRDRLLVPPEQAGIWWPKEVPMVVSVPSVSGGHGGTQDHIDLIVLHGTVGPCTPRHSVSIANYLNNRPGGALSVHEIFDPTTVTVMLGDQTIAYGDGRNTYHWQAEFCDPQAGNPARWNDAAHNAMLAVAAPRIRAACQRNNVPMVRVRAPLTGKRGICGHIDVDRTWPSTGHTDPDAGGPFPWDRFIAMLNGATPPLGDDMAQADVDAINAHTDAAVGNLFYAVINGTRVDGKTPNGLGTRQLAAQIAALSAAVAADPGNGITQAMLDDAVAKGLADTTLTIHTGPAAPPT